MTIAHRGLKVKVKVMGQAHAVGPTSIEGSFFLVSVPYAFLYCTSVSCIISYCILLLFSEFDLHFFIDSSDLLLLNLVLTALVFLGYSSLGWVFEQKKALGFVCIFLAG